MHFTMVLILAAVTAQGNDEPQPDHFDWGGHSAVVLQCDFSHYPPKSNVEFTVSGCDYAIFFDQHPHLRLTTPEQSRLTMKFRLPEVPKAGFLEAEHLASADNEGKSISPVSILINGSPLVEEWNAGQGTCYDNSWPWGVWAVEPETIVATAAAMVGSVEGARKAGRNWFEKSFGGVKDNEYNVVFWKE